MAPAKRITFLARALDRVEAGGHKARPYDTGACAETGYPDVRSIDFLARTSGRVGTGGRKARPFGARVCQDGHGESEVRYFLPARLVE